MQTIEQFRQELAQLAGAQPTRAQAPAARQLAQQGRGGDSMLVHMRPDEVAAMQQMAQQAGTSMSVNPQTGLPEAFKLKDLFDINTYTDPIEKGMKSIGLGNVYDTISGAAKTVGQNAQYILPFIPGSAFASVGLGSLASPMGRGILGGVAGTFANGRPDLRRGLMAGMTAYGLSSAYQGLQGAGGGTGAESGLTTRADTGLELPPGAPAEVPSAQTIAAPAARSEFDAATQGVKNLMSGDKAVSSAANKALGSQFGTGKAQATLMGATSVMSIDEQEKYLEQARAQGQIAEAEYQRMKARIADARRRAEEAMRAHPYRYAMGGEIPLAMKAMPDTETNPYGMKRGGTHPRFIDGAGDGMSDSVPAVIDGKQPARLADGEFVIPADVVSHLGNGSTKAGAKQLYAMMDRVRQARTGTEKQGKEIKPSKYMPA
jgi:hypothetical protein